MYPFNKGLRQNSPKKSYPDFTSHGVMIKIFSLNDL